jgi:hypothetical protein
MKTALAIVCSLMLAWTNVVLASEASVVSTARACCSKCKTPSCCATKSHSIPESQPFSAAPVSFQQHLLPFASVLVVADLPATPAFELSDTSRDLICASAAPIFARNCAWLI